MKIRKKTLPVYKAIMGLNEFDNEDYKRYYET